MKTINVKHTNKEFEWTPDIELWYETENTEKIVKEINITSIKVVLIWSIILLIWLIIWLWIMKASQDNTIQDNIQKIDASNKQIHYLSWIILKAQKGIIVENKNIDNARKILKSKNIDYLK